MGITWNLHVMGKWKNDVDTYQGISSIGAVLLDTFHPVGSYYETSDASFNPNTAWGGTWVLETQGMVHVSGGTDYTVSKANNNNGAGEKDGGESTHILTKSEMPQHTHVFWRQQWFNADTVAAESTGTLYSWKTGTGGSTSKAYIGDENSRYGWAGGGQAHNNMQPYINVYRWHRTA